ncbi:MAG: hypothetical protein ABDH32_04250 [Candidatus Caldarchaeales archaeon]
MSIGLVSATSKNVDESVQEESSVEFRMRIEDLIKEVGRLIEQAEELLEEVEDSGLDVQIYREILDSGLSKYEEGVELYMLGDYNRAFSSLMYAKTRVQIVIRALHGTVDVVQIEDEEELRNELRMLEEKYLYLRSIVEQGVYNESVKDMIIQLEDLINRAKELIDKNVRAAYSIMEKARNLALQIEEAIGGDVHVTTTQSAMKDTKKDVRSSTQTLEEPHIILENNFTSTASFKTLKNKTIDRVEVGLEKSDGSFKVVVEQIERLIDYGNGTFLIVREKIVAVGNKTTISISKELFLGENRSINIGQVSVEQDQSLLGAFFKISLREPEVIRLDQAIEAQIIQAERNKVKVRLKAPDNFPGKLFIIEISPELIDLQNIMSFNLTVNGEEAIMASSLLDLASGTYDRPAYVFVVSAEGVQILLYIPHFSEYVVEITAVLQKILEVFRETLNQVFSRPVMVATTIIATIILLSSAAITLYQKKTLSKVR